MILHQIKEMMEDELAKLSKKYEEPDRYYADHSYRRGRDAMGRYTSRDDYSEHGYSGHNQMSMIEELEILYRASTNEAERENIRKVIDQLKR